MLRMDPFEVEHPTTTDDVVTLLSRHGERAKLCAGGTDVVPNLKHGLHEPEVLIHLGRVQGLTGIEERDDELVIGAMTTIHDVATSAVVKRVAPSFADAAAHVAGPQLRRMGTLGGNLCLDTRCLYYNQTYFWREAMGFCLKKDGELCHVVTSGKKCVAAASNDTATALLCLDATVEVQGASGTRDVKLTDFYVAEGRHNTILEPGELLVRVRVPKRGTATKRLDGFAKLRHRESIDYPLLSVGVCFDTEDDGTVRRAAVVANAIAARPKVVNTKSLVGKKLDDALVDELVALAHKKVTPLTNISDDPAWRKDMVPVYVRRACEAARARA
jgi:4-hydroxybenzoyl-CoA reductase subunit beta